jgi:hypothetical protein
MTFAYQPRCLRVAWALDHLFNAKTGFCNASNPYLTNVTGLPENKLQEALATLESDGAIVRVVTVAPGCQRWRAIYPATALLPSLGSPPPRGVTGSPPRIGVTGHPHLLGVQNLSKRARFPKTEHERARLAAKLRQEREASERGTVVGCPSSEATGDGKGTRLTEDATVGMSRSGCTEDRQSSMLGTESAPDDGIPEFLRRKAKGAAGDRPRDAGGMASDRTIAEEEGEWML